LRIRTGFIANSSASCYFIVGWKLTDEEIEMFVNRVEGFTMKDGIIYDEDGEEWEDGIGEVLYDNKRFETIFYDSGEEEVFYGKSYYWDEGGMEGSTDELVDMVKMLVAFDVLTFKRPPKVYGRFGGIG